MAINLSSIIFELKKDFYHPVSDEHVSALRSILFGNGDRNLEIDKKCEEIKKKSPKELLYIVNTSMETTLVGLAYLRIAEIEAAANPLVLTNDEASSFTSYLNLRGNSQVQSYCLKPEGLAVIFKSGSTIYIYDYVTSGLRAVEAMKEAAEQGIYLGKKANRINFHDGNFRTMPLKNWEVSKFKI